MMRVIPQAVRSFISDFLALNNEIVNTSAVFAFIGFMTGLHIVIVYAFIFQKDVPPNIANMTMAMMGLTGGGFIATLFQKGSKGNVEGTEPQK